MTPGRERLQVSVRMLVAALTRELQLIDDLCRALRRQREGVANADADAVDVSTRAVARMRLTLDEAQRSRAILMLLRTGTPTTSLDALDTYLEGPLPEAIVDVRDAIHRATASMMDGLALNQRIVDRARDGEATLLQHFLSGAADQERSISVAQ